MRYVVLPSQAALRLLLDYNPETGRLIWKQSTSSRIKIGDEAGWIGKRGYRQIRIANLDYRAHRIIFVWMTGTCPEEVDHRDRNPANNRWKNLRASTHQLNKGNTGIRRDNVTGFKGVGFDKRQQKFVASIRHNGKHIGLGYFSTAQEAHRAYCQAAKKFFGSHARVA